MTETTWINHLEKEGLVSIIIPLFNRAGLIETTIQSVLHQTYSNWEIVIVDDHSTDNSFEIALKWQQQEPRVRVFKRERLPKGAPACRNIGIEKAAGEFLIFLDSDDLLAPWCLEKRMEAIAQNSQLDYWVFNGAFFEKDMYDARELWNRFHERKDILRFLNYDTVWQTTAPVWRRSFLLQKQLRFIETALSSQDWEFHVQALLVSDNYQKVDEMPDHFIRRDPSAERISKSHHNREKIVNRIETCKILVNLCPALKNNAVYRDSMRKVIIREMLSLQTKHGVFDREDMKWIKENLEPDFNSRLIQYYLGVANFFFSGSSWLQRQFHRVCSVLFINPYLRHQSMYRSRMSMTEIDQLQKEFNKYALLAVPGTQNK